MVYIEKLTGSTEQIVEQACNSITVAKYNTNSIAIDWQWTHGNYNLKYSRLSAGKIIIKTEVNLLKQVQNGDLKKKYQDKKEKHMFHG